MFKMSHIQLNQVKLHFMHETNDDIVQGNILL